MSLSKSEYNKSAYFYDEIMNSFKMDFSLYEDLIEIVKPQSILELGCGMGRLFPIFMKEAKEITGIDLSDELIDKGEKYFKLNNVNNAKIEFINTDMCSFKMNKKYDLIVFALSVLKHLKTDRDRLEALKNAKSHLNQEGFIVIDHTPFLYSSKSTDWIDVKNSLVVDWLPESIVIDGYQWKKSIEGEKDILLWRYNDSEKTHFEVKFTTYRYDIDKLIQHLSELDLNHELILTEWGVNGLSNKGKRFIGLASYPDNKYSPKHDLLERVIKRNERLWSDQDLYLENKGVA
ncbi:MULTISPECIES: class I SAM-dependent methyltransferase [unclassified Moorena]|uniref:class I SAM-dependent DNA methyltransferase n=1 Tax=unclassified Moorena TaxID=2683338 RepID=UPI0014004DBF|nr:MULTISPECIES: class I SAM-dependent methyltransferase [unclassified Moorena]NEO16945.1 class I SAM-dependent methyltransferase [Moorena sp. SIO3E8]NEP99986.1 class I SAM-dependent methyltransferase [Moorena sp. SIO3F7]